MNMKKNKIIRSYMGICLFCFISLITCSSFGASMTREEECLLGLIENAPDSMSVGELRIKCKTQSKAEEVSVLERRLNEDSENILEPFTLMTHRPTYFMPFAYNFNEYDPTLHQQQINDPSFSFNSSEVQFQLSIKTPLFINLFKKNIDIFAAYTNRSFWQLYNENSSPFRETNHEPEAWIQFRHDWKILGFNNNVNVIGFNHQSNGQSGVLSRSWNRVYGSFVFEKDNLVLNIKPWYRIHERADEDDNPDLTDYMGHYEFRAAYKIKDHVFTFMARNNIESRFRRGAVELSWSFPFGDYPFLRGCVQYFNGYGESLIDYNKNVNRIGIGIVLSDWL